VRSSATLQPWTPTRAAPTATALLVLVLVLVLSPAQVIGLYSSPQAADANARNGGVISGICDNPAALKRLAKDTLTALDHLHK
jgi:hypothetical protein